MPSEMPGDNAPYQRTLPERKFWWIYSDSDEGWGGLRISSFMKTADGTELVYIVGETDRRRIGIRTWSLVQETEGWVKVKEIPVPAKHEVLAAMLNAKEEKNGKHSSETADHSGGSKPGG